MKRIVLISCVSKKGNKKTKAKDLYEGQLFKNSLVYGKKLNSDKIFILSALHHLVSLDQEIEPYNVTLSYVPPAKRNPRLKVLTKHEARLWGLNVLKELGEVADLKNDEFIILAGQSYIKPIKSGLTHIIEPLKGIVLGKRPGKLKELIKEL